MLDIRAGLSTHIGELITRCHTCAKEQPTPREPLKPLSFPARPWERVVTDLYDFQGRIYIIVVWHKGTLWWDFSFSHKNTQGGFRHTWHSTCQTTGHSILQRPFDSLQKRTISNMLLVHQIPPRERRSRKNHSHSKIHAENKRRHPQRLLDLQVNSSTEWLLNHWTTNGTPSANLATNSSSQLVP